VGAAAATREGGRVKTFQQALDYLDDRANWRGPQGIIHLTLLHLKITALALLVGLLIAQPLGLWLGHLRRGGSAVTVIANLSRAIPTFGLLVVLSTSSAFGVSTKTAVVALALFSIPPMLTNTYAGMITIDPSTVEAARGLGMGTRQVLWGVELPLAVPLLAAGIRSAVLQTFATATLASFVGNPTLGTLIQIGQATQRQDEVLAGALVLAALAVLMDFALSGVQYAVTPGPKLSREARFRRRLRGGPAPGVGMPS
jgi:osmoprotectant transport system permease protein